MALFLFVEQFILLLLLLKRLLFIAFLASPPKHSACTTMEKFNNSESLQLSCDCALATH